MSKVIETALQVLEAIVYKSNCFCSLQSFSINSTATPYNNYTQRRSSRKNETEKEGRSDSGNSESLLPEEKQDIRKVIEITVNSIENFSNMKMISKESTGILIRVEHNEITLGASQMIKLVGDDEEELTDVVNVNFTVPFAISVNKVNSIRSAVSTPILITALESSGENDGGSPSLAGNGSIGEIISIKNKARTRTSASKLRGSKENQNPVILGICNFDIMPLLLGEKSVTEKLLLEVPMSHNVGNAIISWENLARLIISAKLLDTHIFDHDMNVNFLNITLESIYNLPSSWTEDMYYKANTIVYVENEMPEDIIFDNGTRTSVPDFERTKCWQSLAHLEGRARFSKYKLSDTVTKNDLKNEIDLESTAHTPRVQWNSMRRSLILQSGCEAMSNAIKRYKHWPFFFTVNGKAREVGKQNTKDITGAASQFQCYADVSELLFPGTMRIRTIAQLHTFSVSAMIEQTGLDKAVFVKETLKEPVTREKELKRGKSSTKGSTATMPAAVSTESENTPSFPLMSENGDPVFVIIEFELHRPLQSARTLEDLTNRIDKMIHPYNLPPNPYTSDLAQKHYSNCIRKLVDILGKGYQDYIDNCSMPDVTFERRQHKSSSPMTTFDQKKVSEDKLNSCDETKSPNDQKDCKYSYIKDEIECFIQYLHETGLYLSMRSTLKNKITMLLDQKFKIEMHMLSEKECQNFVASAYVYLVEEMHRSLNQVIEGRYADGTVDVSGGASSLSYCAEESCALGYMDEARKEYLEMITRDNKNPEIWIEYAIYLIRIKDIDRATECCREAIALNKQHKIALLLYGLILSQKGQFRDAEIFFQAVTQFYPRFTEGWAILHLFYLRTQYSTGADIALQIVQKCIKDKDCDAIPMQFLNREPLLWATLNYPKDRMYLVAAVLLMKLCCFDFASIALAQELLETGRTRYFLYYIAVQHYIEKRYRDALYHLEEAVNVNGMEYSIASLMGHCHLEEGNFAEAIYYYEFANSSFNRPEDLHLMQLRLAHLYLDTNQYESAKKLFLIVCKNSPTCRSWLGVGIACYHLNDIENAEKSLTEANTLDIHNAEVWGYLCLINMSLERYDEFLHCYQQVVKNNLTNTEIWSMIKDLMNNLEYTTPVLSANSQEPSMHESLVTEGNQRSNAEPEDDAKE